MSPQEEKRKVEERVLVIVWRIKKGQSRNKKEVVSSAREAYYLSLHSLEEPVLGDIVGGFV